MPSPTFDALMATLLVPAGALLAVLGMMLVIAGVLVAGLFLPGVVVLMLGMLAFAAAAIRPLVRPADRSA